MAKKGQQVKLAITSISYNLMYMFVCMFVCLEFFVLLENCSLIWRRHHYRWRAANFDLCSALMAVEQWGFFSVPHLLWHRASVYNGHLRGPVSLTSNAQRSAVELSLPVFKTGLSRLEFEYLTLRMWGVRSNRLHHRHGLMFIYWSLSHCALVVFRIHIKNHIKANVHTSTH